MAALPPQATDLGNAAAAVGEATWLSLRVLLLAFGNAFSQSSSSSGECCRRRRVSVPRECRQLTHAVAVRMQPPQCMRQGNERTHRVKPMHTHRCKESIPLTHSHYSTSTKVVPAKSFVKVLNGHLNAQQFSVVFDRKKPQFTSTGSCH